MRECILATCTTDMDYFKDEFEKGFTHPRAENDGLHPELLDCNDTIPASDTIDPELVGKPKLGGHCYIKCKDGYKFAEYGEDIELGSGTYMGSSLSWDENGRLKITCHEAYLGGTPFRWNFFDCYCDQSGTVEIILNASLKMLIPNLVV